MKKAYAILLAFGILLLSGCTSTYVCPNGDKVSNPDDCFKNETLVASCTPYSMSPSCSGSSLYTNYRCVEGQWQHDTQGCEFGCANSACLPAPAATCTDTDNGKNYLVKGAAFNGTMYEDECIGNKIRECWCDGTTLSCETVGCANGLSCKEGKCVSPQCSESDLGDDIYLSGVTINATDTESDNCLSQARLVEYYCDGDAIVHRSVDCDIGYACIGAQCAEYCTDTEPAADALRKGIVNFGEEIYTDSCSGSEVLEYYCKDPKTVSSRKIECGTGKACSDGLCISLGCTDSDQEKNTDGVNRGTRGTVTSGSETFTDYCEDENTLIEYYCSDDDIPMHITEDCGSTKLCKAGACLLTTDVYRCTDTDEGKDLYEFGTAYDAEDEGTDHCVDSNTVEEYFCSGGAVDYAQMDCKPGEACRGGICTAACTDSDGGLSPLQAGTTIDIATAQSDYCINSNTVMEYYCNGDNVDSSERECATGYTCVSGACIHD